jgi:K+-sensing histidine kinase KdpD
MMRVKRKIVPLLISIVCLSTMIVKANSGEIKVETEDSEGAAFIIRLPASTLNP